MSKSFSLNQLTEGIRQRHLGTQNRQLVEKWSRTGLLRGLEGVHRENMSRLLENQASQVLRESSSLSTGNAAGTSSGDMRGFTNIAFPIVRRVFGGLIANDLVSIQPMSLPSGLLFYLDYTFGGALAGSAHALHNTGSSIYNSPSGKGVRSGSLGVGGQYDHAGLGYSRVHAIGGATTILASGSHEGTKYATLSAGSTAASANIVKLHATGTDAKLLQYDPQMISEIESSTNQLHSLGTYFAIVYSLESTGFSGNPDLSLIKEFALAPDGPQKPVKSAIQDGNCSNVRRLNQLGTYTSAGGFVSNPFVQVDDANAALLVICSGTTGVPAVAADDGAGGSDNDDLINNKFSYPILSTLNSADGSTLAIPAFESDFGTTPAPAIPEIDIKVEAVSVVAETRKLRARWSPELAQDLNAYHSLDAEVELTQILSEQIALEIDREILNDLLTQAGAANYYWSRSPGKFVNKETGAEQSQSTSLTPGPAFRGTVREWYETLTETIIDVANQIHRKTLRGSANFVVVGPDVATILEASVMYKPSYTIDGDGQLSGHVIGAEKVGTLSNRFTVYKDPYFPRNKVLVGYKGGSYLETGYVYAPYVPLIVTPTIFAPEDFTPRKGVMTRYGKKMVRSDFYGTVTCQNMNVI